MGVNSFEYFGEKLFDISEDTVTEDVLPVGVTAHDANGDPITGKRVFVNSVNGETGDVVLTPEKIGAYPGAYILRPDETLDNIPSNYNLVVDPDGESDDTIVRYTKQKLTDEQKAQARENIGAVTSYNELKDAPFGEIKSDTITYDGELNDDFVTVLEYNMGDGTMMGLYFKKVSDTVPKMEDLDGKEITVTLYDNGEVTATKKVFPDTDDEIMEDGVIVISDMRVVIIPTDNYQLKDGEYLISVFPNKGTYFYVIGMHLNGKFLGTSVYTEGLTVSDFLFSYVKQKIDKRFLPQYLQFGDTRSDTLKWDGNTDNLQKFGDYYHMSYAMPTVEALSKGYEVVFRNKNGTITTISGTKATESSNQIILSETNYVMILKDGTPGIFFAGVDDIGYVESFTIKGYDGFTNFIPMSEKYIPDSIQRVGDNLIINSSTEGSTKKFKISVDDSGTISAVEVTE